MSECDDSMAWGAGLATIAADGIVLDTWYRWLGWGEFGDDDCPTRRDRVAARHARHRRRRRAASTIRPVRISIDVDAPPASPSDAYLRLHLLSHRLVRAADAEPRRHLRRAEQRRVDQPRARRGRRRRRRPPARCGSPAASLTVHGVDKFPRMTDYVMPTRRAHRRRRSRVRLGAHLAAGTTVMHEGFCNFNAGTLGTSMVEGRITAGVIVGDGSDIGGGASILGTLSGGGKEQVTIGERCLLGAERRHRHQPRRRLRRRGRPVRHGQHAGADARRRGQGPRAVGPGQPDVHPRRPVGQGRRPRPHGRVGHAQRRPPRQAVRQNVRRGQSPADILTAVASADGQEGRVRRAGRTRGRRPRRRDHQPATR